MYYTNSYGIDLYEPEGFEGEFICRIKSASVG